MKTDFDRAKSIQELENDYWPDYQFPTGLVRKCHQFRKIPLESLTLEQIRVLISQNIGLVYLMSTAIQMLHRNILTEAGIYEGDLLTTVLRVEKKYWTMNPELRKQVAGLVKAQRKYIDEKNIDDMHAHVLQIIDQFDKE